MRGLSTLFRYTTYRMSSSSTSMSIKRTFAYLNLKVKGNPFSLLRQAHESVSQQFILPSSGRTVTSEAFDNEFEKAVNNIHYIKISNTEEQMKLAALYLQATEGRVNLPKPMDSDVNIKELEYWNAWSKLGNLPKEEARKQYIAEVTRLCSAEGIF